MKKLFLYATAFAITGLFSISIFSQKKPLPPSLPAKFDSKIPIQPAPPPPPPGINAPTPKAPEPPPPPPKPPIEI